MIQIKELRLGNLVLKDGNITEVTIDLLREIEKAPESFSGVPVNEEWLKKFDIPVKEDRQHEYWFDFKGSWLVEVIQEGSTENNYIAQCFFVHQLQNIYFALTGEEVEEDQD